MRRFYSVLLGGVAALSLLRGASVAARAQPSASHKHALLIGISKYARGGNPDDEWWDLSSDADVAALRTLLVQKFGFAERDIVMLTSRAETKRAGILAAFDSLVAATAPGDVVYIHYSGHGTQVLDTSGDEFDGLDEALVPSDYVSKHDGSRSVIDDEIGAFLGRLAERKPASVLLTFDSCFSGTQTRGGRMVVRGAAYDGPPPPRRSGEDTDPTGLDVSNAAAQGYVVISASRDDQLAVQTDDGSGGSLGLLTYALLQRFAAAAPDTTYRELFEGVFDTMTRRNPAQMPQIEGNIDTVLLDGTAAVPERYVDTRIENDRLVLQQGALHGVTVGSTFGLYPPGTRTFDSSKMVGTARVTAVRATTALLDTPGGAERYRLARAVEAAHKYGDSSLRLEVSGLEALPRAAELSAAVRELSDTKGLVRAVHGGAWDLKVCGDPCPEEIATPRLERGGSAGVRLVRDDGSLASAVANSAELPARFADAVTREARWRLVAGLDRTDPRASVEVRLVPVDVTVATDGRVTAAAARRTPFPTVTGKPTLAVGDYFMVEVRNTGTLDAFVTVLDLSPDGSINPIWPHPAIGAGAQDNKVKVEAADPRHAPWHRIPFPYVFKVGPPTGTEIIKAIATDVPADFTALLTPATRGAASRGEQQALKTPVGRLLASVTRPSTRGADQSANPADPTAWSAASFTFVITAPPSK